MKLWHDDIRRPTPGYDAWARTNTEAKWFLMDHDVHLISMDHDLGLHEEDPDQPNADLLIGRGEETGFHLIDWMIEHDLVPSYVEIHSMNGSRGPQMVLAINKAAERGLLSNRPLVRHRPFRLEDRL